MKIEPIEISLSDIQSILNVGKGKALFFVKRMIEHGLLERKPNGKGYNILLSGETTKEFDKLIEIANGNKN